LVIAATGVGAGDLVAAAVAGSKYGFAIVWAAAAGALLKLALNEGLARWQLASGTTLFEGWVQHLGRWVQYIFLVYLLVWSFIVANALVAACGLAAHALAPGLSVAQWGAIHSLAAAGLVLAGGYRSFERVIGVFVAVMFLTLIGCALLVAPPLESASRIVREAAIPVGAVPYLLGVVGGVGGSVTMLSYGYWIREKGWDGPRYLRTVRLDLAVAYGLTGAFGLAVMVLASQVLHASGSEVAGNQGVLTMAGMLSEVIGPVGRWTFLVGFWGAVATSMLGVWQGVPYLFADFVGLLRRLPSSQARRLVQTRSPWYRGFLAFLALAPLVPILPDRPVGIITVYAVMSALFMPFLAGTLLMLNRARTIGEQYRNRWPTIGALIACLVLFGYLAIRRLTAL
jgi:Mn2+/Fe2+ NRAMP family transporter